MPYQLRHTFATGSNGEGAKSRIKLYMGDDSRTVTDDYLWHEVEEFLVG